MSVCSIIDTLYTNIDLKLRNKYMDQRFTKKVLHVYLLDTWYILCYNNTTICSTYFKIQQTL